jgi:hypothetical protein
MARRLRTIAKWVNANMADKGYVARIERGYCNTDRKIGRLRSPGKGREGNKLVVTRYGTRVLEHDSSQTYRMNSEVESWLEGELAMLARPDSERWWTVSWWDSNPNLNGRRSERWWTGQAPNHEMAKAEAKKNSLDSFDNPKVREMREHEVRDHLRYANL